MKGEFRVVPPDDGRHEKVGPQGVLIWRIISAIMSVFFLLAAYVNLNDGDWYIWVPVYTIPGVLSLISCIKQDSPNSALWSYSAVIFLGLCIVLAIYIIASAIGLNIQGVNNPLEIEEGREIGGVFIMITWISITRFTNIGRPGGSVNNNVLRNSLLLMACMLVIVPVILWSSCFHDVGKGYGHCKGMFQNGFAKNEF